MAPLGRPTTLQERMAIADGMARGQTDPQIATALGPAVATVRKWRRIAQQQGAQGLGSQMGRPPTGALGSLPSPLRATLRHWRDHHPGWGPDTLLAELRRDPYWASQKLPSRARVAAFLRQEGLARRYQKQRDLPQPPPANPGAPHSEWQLDAQGATSVAGLGTVCLINVVDVVSRLKVESYPYLDGIQPTMADYQLVLRRAFTTYGLPKRISFDHGSAFYDNTTPSPFPTRLHLWLLALGVDVIFTRKRCPTDHALIERMHQTMTQQALLGQRWIDQTALWYDLDDRRLLLNTAIPSAALAGQAPLQAFPEAAHSGRSYRPEWEAEVLELARVDAYLAHGQWFRTTNCHGEFWLGMQRYNLGKQFGRHQVALSFDASERTLICQPEGSAELRRFPIKGLTTADLMGELSPLLALPVHQLALPWTPEAWRCLELARWVSDTTL